MNISLVREGLLQPAKLNAWTLSLQADIRKRVHEGMRDVAPEIVAAARTQAASALKGNKAARSIRSRIWRAKPERLPALQIHSKIPWLGVHETGAVITGKMLIQIGRGTKRRGDFRKLIARARTEGRSFFLKAKDGKTYLMVKQAGKGDGLTRFKSHERQKRRSLGGSGRIKRTEAVPVAILVNRITIKKRLRMTETVQRLLPRLARAIEES